MNCKKIILCAAIGLMGLTSQASNAQKNRKSNTVTATPANIYWTDGNGRVTYNTNAKTSQVVKIALDLFESDMKAVTGLAPKQKSNATIQIYQVDMLSNKEFSAVEKLGTPLHQIITVKDAYYIGTRNKKIIVIGSNARGTAYAIMHLSQMAGVSPWAAWNDLQPQTRRTLSTPVGQEWIEIPRIKYRGLALNNCQWMKPQNYSQLARLMLRLKANTLWQMPGKRSAAYNKAVVDSFDICMAANHKVIELVGKKHKKHKTSIDNVKFVFDDPQMDLSTVSPGIMPEVLNSEDDAWIANVTNPKLSCLQLSMMMQLAWNKDALKAGSKCYLLNWLCEQFGDATGKRVQPLMEEYYRLTNIRQPAYMAMPYGDTEFHSGEFGNELERYLYRYDQLKANAERIERSLPADQKDGFFEIVKYPIFSAALIAEKELEAQEARHIARPGLFDSDNEAKTAAAVSLSAYNTLQQLDRYFSNLRNGKWCDYTKANSAEKQAPQLPGTLSAADIKHYRQDAFDRSADLKPLSVSINDVFAKNAWEWSSATKSAVLCPLVGHSNKAVKLSKGAMLNYNFYSNKSGDVRFTLAVIPSYGATNKSMRASVSIDHATPVVCQFGEAYNSKQWKLDLWRGQALKSFYATLPSGSHSIEIKALDDDIIIDQWILDYDVDREYYVFPVQK